jgi:DNA-directed RNA polymerase subunit RPC12/RpoP
VRALREGNRLVEQQKDKIERVIFVEVKTGQSKLTKREKSLKETIEKKRVGWKEINIDTPEEELPDKKMENEETSINDLYETINKKVSSVKNKPLSMEKEETEEIEGKTDFICSECGKEFSLEIDGEDSLEEGIETDCPYCKEEVILYEENLKENEDEEDEWECEHCGKTFELDEEQEDEIDEEGSIEVECPYCHKMTTCEYEE